MPIYEYQCDSCRQIKEVLKLNGDSDPISCKCGGKLSKIMSLSSFHLKGAGWYETDYKRKGKSKEVENG
jgi:putative FmdB family regulatory protein